MTQAANREKLIRRNRRMGVITLGLVAFGLAGSALLGEGLSASSWTMVVLTVIGLGELFTARLVRLERDDPAGNERRERQFEAAAVVVGVGLPLAALLAVAVLVVVILLR
jgi:hypothetical protein